MNIQDYITTGLVSAYLACTFIPLYSFSFLSMPVWAIVIYMTTTPIGIVYSSSISRRVLIHAILRTKVATSQSDMMSSCFIFLSTLKTVFSNMYFWLLSCWLRAAYRHLRGTGPRASNSIAVNPFNKLFFAYLASVYLFLSGVLHRYAPCCVSLNFKSGACDSGKHTCQWVITPFKPMSNYTISRGLVQ